MKALGSPAGRQMLSEDREYVERILAGEPEAFEALVRKYNRVGGAIAFAIVGDFHLAEDVVQDAFIRAFRSLAALRDPDRFKFWFSELVRSRALDVLRQRRAHGTEELPEEFSLDTSKTSSVEEEQMRKELRQRILRAIGELPEEDRLVVVLKHMEGLSYKEIADIMNTSVGAVESRLFRARHALRKKLPTGQP